jgi:hypothetical protein
MSPQPPVKSESGHQNHKRDAWDWFKLVLESLAFVALVFYTCETRRTNNLTQQSLTTIKEQFRADQRPYIWLSNARNVSYSDSLQAPIWNCEYGNFGRSPAYKIRGSSVLITGHDAMHQAVAFPADFSGAPLPPTKTDASSALPKSRMNKDAYASLLRTDETFVIRGRIQYTDAYGEPYETGFCMLNLGSGFVMYCKEDNSNYIK